MPITERFRVRGDDGSVHNAVCFQADIDTTTFEAGKSSMRGMKEYRLASGAALNYIDENTFRTVDRKLYKRIPT